MFKRSLLKKRALTFFIISTNSRRMQIKSGIFEDMCEGGEMGKSFHFSQHKGD